MKQTADEFLDGCDAAGRIHLHLTVLGEWTATRKQHGSKCNTDECAIIEFEELIDRGNDEEEEDGST